MPLLTLTTAHMSILARMNHYASISVPRHACYDAADQDASTAFWQLVDGGFVCHDDDYSGRFNLLPKAYDALYGTEE